MFLSVAFFAMFFVFGNLDYSTVFSIAPFINENTVTIIGLLLLLAAMGKSAQLGLHTWLPDAMEGRNNIGIIIIFALLCCQVYNPMLADMCSTSTSIFVTPILLTVSKQTLGGITGCMLGDGSIRSSSSTKKGTIRGNARYGITIKKSSICYMEHLRNTIFSSFKPSQLYAYPNVLLSQHNGKEVQHFHFSTASTPFFTELHALWYVWNMEIEKFVKIVPHNILDFFTVESLIH